MASDLAKKYLSEEDFKLYEELLSRVPRDRSVNVFELAGITNRSPTPFVSVHTSTKFQELVQKMLSWDDVKLGDNLGFTRVR